MDRRTLLRTGSLAALGLGLGGCAREPKAPPLARTGPKPRPALGLVPVNASWDRVIHTTVGLRPYRASGFVVKPERLDRKTVIHNYGHGGNGFETCWGTADQVRSSNDRNKTHAQVVRHFTHMHKRSGILSKL